MKAWINDSDNFPEITAIEGSLKAGNNTFVRVTGRNFRPDTRVILASSIQQIETKILSSENIELIANSSTVGNFPLVVKNGSASSADWGVQKQLLSRFAVDSGWIDLRNSDLTLAGEIVSYNNFLETTRNLSNSGYYQNYYGLSRQYASGNTNNTWQFLKFPSYKSTFEDNPKFSLVVCVFDTLSSFRVGVMPSEAENYYNDWTPQRIGGMFALNSSKPLNFAWGQNISGMDSVLLSSVYPSFGSGNPKFIKCVISFSFQNLKFEVFEVSSSNFDEGIFICEETIPFDVWQNYYNSFAHVCPGCLAQYTFDLDPNSNSLVAFRVH